MNAFFAWLKRLTSTQPNVPRFFPGPGLYAVEVKGESHYQQNLAALCGPRKKDGENLKTSATLHLENSNRADRNAVRIEIGGRQVGYLNRDNAVAYRQELKRLKLGGQVGQCNAIIRGGWKRKGEELGMYGVWLDFPTR